MALAPSLPQSLLGCDDFRVVTADARIGVVEEIWRGDDGAAIGLAIRTDAGKRGLVLAGDVSTVDREHRWVVVDPGIQILELEPPRVVESSDGARHLQAAWATSGNTLPVGRPERRRSSRAGRSAAEPSVLRSIVLLYVALALVVTVVMALAFVVPYFAA